MRLLVLGFNSSVPLASDPPGAFRPPCSCWIAYMHTCMYSACTYSAGAVCSMRKRDGASIFTANLRLQKRCMPLIWLWLIMTIQAHEGYRHVIPGRGDALEMNYLRGVQTSVHPANILASIITVPMACAKVTYLHFRVFGFSTRRRQALWANGTLLLLARVRPTSMCVHLCACIT